MRTVTLALLALIAIQAVGPTKVSAQFSSGGGGNNGGGFGGQGGGGSGGFGGAGGGGGGFGGAGWGGGGGFGGAGGGGGFGQQGGMGQGGGFGQQGGMGQGGFGQNGTGGMNNNNQQGNFLGRNINANQFLGRSPQGTTNGQNPNQQQNNRGRATNRGGQNNFNQQQQQQTFNNQTAGAANQQPPIRPRLKIDFEFPKPQLVDLSSKLEARITKNKAMKDIKITTDPSGDLVLTGNVASEHDAKLAVSRLMIEPGVRNVRNELTYPMPEATE